MGVYLMEPSRMCSNYIFKEQSQNQEAAEEKIIRN